MSHNPEVKLYGSETCHKTEYYKTCLVEKGIAYSFLDVVKNESFAKELRDLYASGKLHFPTITIKEKTLRNPYNSELDKWIAKLK